MNLCADTWAGDVKKEGIFSERVIIQIISVASPFSNIHPVKSTLKLCGPSFQFTSARDCFVLYSTQSLLSAGKMFVNNVNGLVNPSSLNWSEKGFANFVTQSHSSVHKVSLIRSHLQAQQYTKEAELQFPLLVCGLLTLEYHRDARYIQHLVDLSCSPGL